MPLYDIVCKSRFRRLRQDVSKSRGDCLPRRVAAEEIPVAEKGQISCGGTLLAQQSGRRGRKPVEPRNKRNPKAIMSEHDKNLFIEKHTDGYAILRGGVKKPLAVEPTQDAAIENGQTIRPRCSHSRRAGSKRRRRRPRQMAAHLKSVRLLRASWASSAPGSPAGPRRCR